MNMKFRYAKKKYRSLDLITASNGVSRLKRSRMLQQSSEAVFEYFSFTRDSHHHIAISVPWKLQNEWIDQTGNSTFSIDRNTPWIRTLFEFQTFFFNIRHSSLLRFSIYSGEFFCRFIAVLQKTRMVADCSYDECNNTYATSCTSYILTFPIYSCGQSYGVEKLILRSVSWCCHITILKHGQESAPAVVRR